MTDFSGGSLRQYLETNDKGENIGDARLCKNTARMTFMPEWDYTKFAFFKDRLEFNKTNGEFVNPDQGIDRETKAYPDGTHLPWKANGKAKRDHNSTLPERYTPNKNHLPDHLTVSYISSHSARKLCESDTSRGADFVAINDDEKLFCDMTRKKLVDVCDEKVTRACFELETKEMRDVGAKIRKRDLSYGTIVPRKSYKTHAVWGKK